MPGAGDGFARKREMHVVQLERVQPGDTVERARRGGHQLRPDAVSGQESDPLAGHQSDTVAGGEPLSWFEPDSVTGRELDSVAEGVPLARQLPK
jgi:hypothetical protein